MKKTTVKSKLAKVISNKYFRAIGAVLMTILIALFLTWFLEYRYFIDDAGATWDFVVTRPRVFLYNSFIVWQVLVILTAILRRPVIAGGVLWAVIIVIGFVNANKYIIRGAPLLPEDLQLASEAGSLASFVPMASIVGVIISMILAVGLGIFANILWRKVVLKAERHVLADSKKYSSDDIKSDEEYEEKTAKKPQAFSDKERHFTFRLLLVVVTVGALIFSTDFIRHHRGQKYERVDFLESELVAWNQTRNYNNNGFILGFLYNLQKFETKAPDGYSEIGVRNIAMEYKSKAFNDNQSSSKQSLADADYNIVVILNESFYDPSILAGYYDYSPRDIKSKEELLPNLRKIQQENLNGRMYSLDYGGGTANVEFEALTGLTNYWLETVPYTNLIPHINSLPSLASVAKDNGYKTTAIHAYNGSMYKRNVVLPKMGFDEFIDEAAFKYRETEGGGEAEGEEHTETTGQYINDESSYKEVLDILNGEGKQFVALVTMQNHTPYDPKIYSDGLEFMVTKPEVGSEYNGQEFTEEDKLKIETYLQTLHNSDKYLGEFIEELNKSDKKTVVMFFGDHSAGLFPISDKNENKEVRDLSRETPYFIYTNFDLKAEKSENDELPMTTPNCLGNTLLSTLKVKKTALEELTASVCEITPILTANYLDEEGAPENDTLKDYQTVTYDLLSGKQYWLEYN